MQTTPPESDPPSLVVSIHDVAPATRRLVERILSDLAEAGVGRTSLLVVPDYHRQGVMNEDPVFCAWLRRLQEGGHEMVLHGYEHLRERRVSDRPWKRLVTECYTAGEGEFHDLDRAEAARRLERGRAAFGAAGLRARGFIAPAWLLGKEAFQAVTEAGFDYTVTLRQFIPLDGRPPTHSQSMVYSVRAAWRRRVSLIWNSMLFARLRRVPLLRLSLHPVDWEHPAIRAHAMKSVGRALVRRTAIPYEGWRPRSRGPS